MSGREGDAAQKVTTIYGYPCRFTDTLSSHAEEPVVFGDLFDIAPIISAEARRQRLKNGPQTSERPFTEFYRAATARELLDALRQVMAQATRQSRYVEAWARGHKEYDLRWEMQAIDHTVLARERLECYRRDDSGRWLLFGVPAEERWSRNDLERGSQLVLSGSCLTTVWQGPPLDSRPLRGSG